ncbi:hypothetical protein [Pseudomonas capeferrum]|uniref:hypothetical protein n=1 Tax=Pseudomonas capeferrum TaxID=1495066 RepID=UPI0030DB82C1
MFALAALIRAGIGASSIARVLLQKEIENCLFREVVLETGNNRVDYHFAFLKHDHRALGYMLGDLARQCIQEIDEESLAYDGCPKPSVRNEEPGKVA